MRSESIRKGMAGLVLATALLGLAPQASAAFDTINHDGFLLVTTPRRFTEGSLTGNYVLGPAGASLFVAGTGPFKAEVNLLCRFPNGDTAEVKGNDQAAIVLLCPLGSAGLLADFRLEPK